MKKQLMKILFLLWIAAMGALYFFQTGSPGDNLTGLAWQKHLFWPVALWSLLMVTQIGWLSAHLLFSSLNKRQRHEFCLCLSGMELSLFIPYGLHSVLNDLHIWLCVICVCTYLYFWLLPLRPDKGFSWRLQHCARWIGISAAVSFALLAWAGQVSLLCELVFLFSQVLILSFFFLSEAKT